MANIYENLANAIILKAVEDYRKSQRTLSKCPYDNIARRERNSIERFFRSDFFCILSNLDPEVIIGRLNEEVAE